MYQKWLRWPDAEILPVDSCQVILKGNETFFQMPGAVPTLNPQPLTLIPQLSTLNPQASTLDPQPSTLNPQPYPLNPIP